MIVYKDTNEFYDGIKDKIPELYNIDVIFQSIQNILTTPKGTRAFLPEFGCDLEQYLFELDTDVVRELILTEIFEAINKWEPRVKMIYNLSDVDAENKDEHIFKIKVIFKVIGLNKERFKFSMKIKPRKK